MGGGTSVPVDWNVLNDKNDHDHWFEVPHKNADLFDELTLEGCDEILPGRLFTTRISRSGTAEFNKFKQKVKFTNLHTVLVLAEANEFKTLAGESIGAFYKSLGVHNIIHRPIADFKIPNQKEMMSNIKDLTFYLLEGRCCLVQCCGGNGRTGLVVAGVMKNVGLKDPVGWVRKVKPEYIETEEQEIFVEDIPPVMDAIISFRHPILAKAIAAQQILSFLIQNNKVPWDSISGANALTNKEFTAALKTNKKWNDYSHTFDLIDQDKSGYISQHELIDLFKDLGATITLGHLKAFMATDQDDGRISRMEFLQMMTINAVIPIHHPELLQS